MPLLYETTKKLGHCLAISLWFLQPACWRLLANSRAVFLCRFYVRLPRVHTSRKRLKNTVRLTQGCCRVARHFRTSLGLEIGTR